MSQQEPNAPPDGPRRFSWGRVSSTVALVLVAAGTFAAVWFIPFPRTPKREPPATAVTPERIHAMKRLAERLAEEERAERERAAKEAEGK